MLRQKENIFNRISSPSSSGRLSSDDTICFQSSNNSFGSIGIAVDRPVSLRLKFPKAFLPFGKSLFRSAKVVITFITALFINWTLGQAES